MKQRISLKAERAVLTKFGPGLTGRNILWVDAFAADGSSIRLSLYLPANRDIETVRYLTVEEAQEQALVAVASDMQAGGSA